MATEHDDGRALDLLRAARGATLPPDDLVARVLADAAWVQAEQTAATEIRPPAPRRRLRGIVAALGGWRAVSGLTLAGATGLAVGFAAPDLVDSLSGGQIWLLSGGGGAMPEIGALAGATWEEFGDV